MQNALKPSEWFVPAPLSDRYVTRRYKSCNMFYYLLLSAKYWKKHVFLSIYRWFLLKWKKLLIITRVVNHMIMCNIGLTNQNRGRLKFSDHTTLRRFSNSPYLMFFIKDHQRRIYSCQIRQLPCRARGTRAHWLFSHLPFSMDDFVHEYVFSFCKSIDWCVQYKNNQTLYFFIKYVA